MSNEDKPPRIPPRVKAAPKIRQVYWCDFPDDAQLPEFWKRRPVVIISMKARLHGCVTVLPLTTKSQPDNPMAHPIISPLDGKRAWVICDHLTTFAVSRLIPPDRHIPRLGEEDFAEVVDLLHSGLPRPSSKR